MIACDVLVAGGGSAGLAAAVAAARAGADTLLVERGAMLGGMGSSALVHTICGLFEIRDEPRAHFANGGFAREFATRLLREGGAREPVRMGKLDVLPHDPVHFALLGDAFASETRGLRVWLHTELIGAEKNPTRLENVEIICRGQREKICAKTFIDTTGDATLTALAGADFSQIESSKLQRPAFVATLRGLDPALLDGDAKLRLAHAIANAAKTGDLPQSALGAAFRAGVAPDEAFITIDLAGDLNDGSEKNWDPTSPDQLTAIEMTGRRTALAVARFFSEKIDGMKNCRVVAWPSRAGVRESRRACGVHELSGDDILSGADFPDAIANVAWPMELREKPTGPRWRYPENNRAAKIPLRALRHRDVENLWIAGRCISCSHEAQAAIRVMGTCLAAGEVAGIAAAMTMENAETSWQALAARVIDCRENFSRSI
jgi:FAD dependent oxidoreductase